MEKWKRRTERHTKKTVHKPYAILDALLDLLKDGQWHNWYEIDTTVPLPTMKTIELIRFLENFDFLIVTRDEEDVITEVKLEPKIAEFIRTLEAIGRG